MKVFSPKDLIKRKNKENLSNFDKDLVSNKFQQKIRDWSDKFDFIFDDVMKSIRENIYLKASFVKDPLKQNYVRNKFADWIKTSSLVENFQKLTAQDKNKIHLDEGQIFKKSKGIKLSVSNPLDFRWEVRTEKGVFECYALYKYIERTGGAQDQQYEKMRTLIKNAPYDEEDKKLLFVFCDGEYFQKNDKLDDLKKVNKQNKCCLILKSNEFEQKVNQLLEEF